MNKQLVDIIEKDSLMFSINESLPQIVGETFLSCFFATNLSITPFSSVYLYAE